MKAPVLIAVFAAAVVVASLREPPARYDPLEVLRRPRPAEINAEATVPPMCYTKTAGVSNPCWTCHVKPGPGNHRNDWTLQEEYAFSEYALVNRWSNLFRDRRAEIARMSDDDILRYIRGDNYELLRSALAERPGYEGYRPDLDLALGFDAEGFARDGSGWRALRFKPFPGTFWPTNGSADDVFIRLPDVFRRDAQGRPSTETYKLNLAILEAAVARAPEQAEREVEPVDERLLGVDLDGNGRLNRVSRIRRLPPTYAGSASGIAVQPWAHPEDVEFLHTVRYLDPDAPALLSRRLKELRYSRKVLLVDEDGRIRHYADEDDDKFYGKLPGYPGSPAAGFRNRLGWLYQGYIEDRDGRLRVQTTEEHRTCMGCHTGLGVTVDSTFSFARKVPGREGWRPQDLRGMRDVPQAGHAEPEVLAYFRRVGGGDEFRANGEILARWFRNGEPDEAAVRAAPDHAALLAPSRARALALDKAYRLLVLEQSFAKGRDALIGPALNVHAKIEGNTTTDLGKTRRVFGDGRLWLDWNR